MNRALREWGKIYLKNYKVHFTHSNDGSYLSVMGNLATGFTRCGWRITYDRITRFTEKVTCNKCISILNKRMLRRL